LRGGSSNERNCREHKIEIGGDLPSPCVGSERRAKGYMFMKLGRENTQRKVDEDSVSTPLLVIRIKLGQ